MLSVKENTTRIKNQMWIFKCLNKNLKTKISGNIYQSLVPDKVLLLQGSRTYTGPTSLKQLLWI